MERSITYLEGHADTADKKLDLITAKIATAEATFNTLKFVFIAACIATWGLISALVVAWATHHFNW